MVKEEHPVKMGILVHKDHQEDRYMLFIFSVMLIMHVVGNMKESLQIQ